MDKYELIKTTNPTMFHHIGQVGVIRFDVALCYGEDTFINTIGCLVFVPEDGSEPMATSIIVSMKEHDGVLEIKTKNSTYTFKKILS